MSLKMIGMVTAAIMGTVAVASATWTGLDYLEIRPVLLREFVELKTEVAANTRDAMIRRFQELDVKKKSSLALTPQEFAEWCEIGQRLGWIKECLR